MKVKRQMHITKDGIYLEVVTKKEFNSIKRLGQKDAYLKAIYKIEELPAYVERKEVIMVIKELLKKLS